MNIALENIFKKPEPKTRYVKIVQKTDINRWKVVDVYGRYFFVDSQETWKKGESVSVQQGRIIEKVANLAEPTRYEG